MLYVVLVIVFTWIWCWGEKVSKFPFHRFNWTVTIVL